MYKPASDVDYSKYLGPDYRSEKFKGKQVSTVISNHISFLDILINVTRRDRYASFTPAGFVEKIGGGIGDWFVRVIQPIYIHRD